MRDFKHLKGTWHQMIARSHQLQGIFGLLKPFIHVHILICFVDVYQNHGVQYVANFLAQTLTLDNLYIKNLNFVVIFFHKVARVPPDNIYDSCHDGIDHLLIIQPPPGQLQVQPRRLFLDFIFNKFSIIFSEILIKLCSHEGFFPPLSFEV